MSVECGSCCRLSAAVVDAVAAFALWCVCVLCVVCFLSHSDAAEHRCVVETDAGFTKVCLRDLKVAAATPTTVTPV